MRTGDQTGRGWTRRSLLAGGVALLLSPRPTRAQDMMARPGVPGIDLVAKQEHVDSHTAQPLDNKRFDLARAIGNDVVCLCGDCGRRTITDCECYWAGPNKIIIQNLVAKGMGREEIITAYRKAYGDQVLTMLPNEGLARAAWLLPYTAAIAGLGTLLAVGITILRRKPQADEAPPAPPAGAEASRRQLERELEDLD